MVEIGKLNLELGQGGISRPSMEVPHLDQVKSWISSHRLATTFSNPQIPNKKYLIPPLGLGIHSQGVTLTHETTYLLCLEFCS